MGILQARILEWFACPSPGGLPNPGIEPRSPALQEDSLPAELPEKPMNTGVGTLSFLQEIFPTQGSNPSLVHCRQILYQLSYQGSLIYVLIYCLCLFLSHLLHSVIGSRFSHLIRTDPNATLFNIPLCICINTTASLCIHLLMDI